MFYGWWIVVAAFVVLLVAVGVGLYVPPVFLVPLQEHFGWSRGVIAGGSAIAALGVGVVSPLVGVWIDRWGPRRVMTAGALVMGSSFALLGLVRSVWQLYALNLLVALGLASTAWIPAQTLVSNWFDRKRGRAMGLALAGIGVGGLVMAPLAGFLITELGWRRAFVGLGALLLLVAVPAILVVRSRPAEMGLLPDGDPPAPPDTAGPGTVAAAASDPGLGLSASVRSGSFWMLSLAHLLWTFGSMSVVAHVVAFLHDTGFENAVAATCLGAAIGVSIPGRLVFGFLADRFARKTVMASALILHALSVVCLLGIHVPLALPGFVVLFGLGIGGGAVLVPLLVGDCFGLLSFGKILGLVMISATLGAAGGPVLTGLIYDGTGSYRAAFLLHIGAFLAATLAIVALRGARARRPAEVAQASVSS